MAKHLADPDHPAFRITDSDREGPAKHRKQDGDPKPARLRLLLNDVAKPERIAQAS